MPLYKYFSLPEECLFNALRNYPKNYQSISSIETTKEKVISDSFIEEAFSYNQYRQLVDKLLERGRATGDHHSENIIDYTRMNVQRMNRLDDRITLSDSLKEALEKVYRKWTWLVLTEGWCGDAAQNLPVIHKMAEYSPNIELKLLLRDKHPEVMDAYLTDGSRSIPKLVCLDAETLEEIGTWGPRPATLQEKALQWKEDPDISNEEWATRIHKWYAENRSREQQREFEELIESWT